MLEHFLTAMFGMQTTSTPTRAHGERKWYLPHIPLGIQRLRTSRCKICTVGTFRSSPVMASERMYIQGTRKRLRL
jgi:hypothetical protein